MRGVRFWGKSISAGEPTLYRGRAEVVDGRAGLLWARERRPDVVLIDLTMPTMDGFDFLSELRRLPGCAEAPVVVLTARDVSNDDRRRLRGAGQVLNKGDIGMRALVGRLHGLADHPRLPV